MRIYEVWHPHNLDSYAKFEDLEVVQITKHKDHVAVTLNERGWVCVKLKYWDELKLLFKPEAKVFGEKELTPPP